MNRTLPKVRLPGRRAAGGLTARIIAWSLAPTTIILAIVALFVLYTYQQVTVKMITERNQALTSLLGGQIGVEMTRYADLLDNLAANPDIQSFVFPVQQTALRGAMGVTHLFDGGVIVLDEQGEVAAADPRRLDLLGQNWSSKEIYRQLALLQTSYFVSDVEWLGTEQSPMIAVGMSIRPTRQPFSGVVVGLFRLDQEQPNAFYRSLLKFHVRPTNIYFVDSQGHLIEFAQRHHNGQDISDRPAVQAALAGTVGALRIQNAAGEATMTSFAPVPNTSLIVIEEESWAAVTATISYYGWLLILLLLLGLVAPPLVIVAGIRHITQPLQALTLAADDISRGKLRQEIVVSSPDEVGRLAAAFNHMSAQLHDLYEGLERKVQDRTRELATLNAIADVVSRSLRLEEILEGALKQTVKALDLSSGVAFHLDPTTAQMTLVAQTGSASTLSALAEDLCHGKSTLADPGSKPSLQPLIFYPDELNPPLLGVPDSQVVVRVPLVSKEKILGVMLLGCVDPQRVDSKRIDSRKIEARQLSLLAAIGQQVGMAMENALLYEEAEEAAAAAERQRLAQELHDSVTQTLFSANLIAGVLPLLWENDPQEGHTQLAALQQLTQGALAEMRLLLLELRPAALAQAPMDDLLRQMTEAVSARARIPVALNVQGTLNLPPEIRIAFYRVAQEALNNVVKHARACEVTLSISCAATNGAAEVEFPCQRVRLCISDNGCGFDPAQVPANHLGLRIMQERAASIGAALRIESRPGRGTQLELTWPGPGKAH